jgi:hypothetical protein
MRAREFTINVPIRITINGDNDPEIETNPEDSEGEPDLQQNPVMVPPLQQELELRKAALGKETPVIDKLTADHDQGEEPEDSVDPLQRLRSLIEK